MYFDDKYIWQWHSLAHYLFLWSHAFPKTVNIFGHQVCSRNEPSRRTVGTSDGDGEEILKLRGRTRIPVAFKDVEGNFVSP